MVGVRVMVGVKVWVEVGVPVGSEVGVSEGARVFVLTRVGSNVGVSGWEDRADPLHPVRTMSTRMNKRTIALIFGIELYSVHLQNVVQSRRGGRNRPIIYRKWGSIG